MSVYAIQTKKRKYTTTPIVELILLPDGRTEEKFITCLALPKKEGDNLSLAIVESMNLAVFKIILSNNSII